MTLNERCAKCLGWTRDDDWYWDADGNITEAFYDFDPEHNREHAQLMVEAVRDEIWGKFCDALLPAMQEICDWKPIATLLVHEFGNTDSAMSGVVAKYCFLATPAQISKAACEVLENHDTTDTAEKAKEAADDAEC